MNETTAEALSIVLKRIPLKVRKELSAQIHILCESTGLENNFMINRCGLYSGARSESAGSNISKAHLRRRLSLKKYWVEIVGVTDPQPCTLAEAAKLMRVKETSLKVRVSLTRNYEKEILGSDFSRDKSLIDGYYICSKMTEEEQRHFENKPDATTQQVPSRQSDIQSASPAHP